MRTPEEEAECRKSEEEFLALRVKVCSQVEQAARDGASNVILQVDDVRQLLHVLAIRPYKAKTAEEALADLRTQRR